MALCGQSNADGNLVLVWLHKMWRGMWRIMVCRPPRVAACIHGTQSPCVSVAVLCMQMCVCNDTVLCWCVLMCALAGGVGLQQQQHVGLVCFPVVDRSWCAGVYGTGLVSVDIPCNHTSLHICGLPCLQ